MTRLPRHIHLSGICGTAMASLAGLLQLQGHRITGSDKAAYPPMLSPTTWARSMESPRMTAAIEVDPIRGTTGGWI